MKAGKRNLYKYILAYGHLCADITQGALSAILPFLIAAYHYNYATAAVLVMVSNIVGSIIQPVFGVLADKKNRPVFMTIGVLMSGFGMGIVGIVSNFGGMCLAVMISGIGTSLFHPQGAQLINHYTDEDKKGFALGLFSFGGNLGFTLGPIFATSMIGLIGLRGTLFFFIPPFVFSIFATIANRRLDVAGEQFLQTNSKTVSSSENEWGQFCKLGALVICRSIIFSGVNTFLVLYLISNHGLSESLGNTLLSVYYACSAIAALLGGKIADMIGHKKILCLSFCIFLPSVLLFALSGYTAAAVALLIPMGIGISLGYSPMILLGQQYLPGHMGFASGITLGLTVTIGGIVAPLFGRLGDRAGLQAVFFAISVFALAAVILSFMMRKPKSVEFGWNT